MTDETRDPGVGLGELQLGSPCEEVGPDLGQLFEAHDTKTGKPSLLLLSGTRVDWNLEEGWEVRLSGKRTLSSVRMDVERAPASGRTTKLVDVLSLMLAALKRVEDSERMDAHLTGRRAKWTGRLPRGGAAWPVGALAALLVVSLGLNVWLSFSGGVGREERVASVSAAETREPAEGFMVAAAGSEKSPIAYPIPEKPFRKQATPPCASTDDEVEIKGGCWVQLARKPPCLVKSQAEYEGKCYRPVAKEDPPLQSVEP